MLCWAGGFVDIVLTALAPELSAAGPEQAGCECATAHASAVGKSHEKEQHAACSLPAGHLRASSFPALHWRTFQKTARSQGDANCTAFGPPQGGTKETQRYQEVTDTNTSGFDPT